MAALETPAEVTAQVTAVNECQSSIEFDRNAKGEPRWTVKIYFNQHEDGAADAVVNEIARLDAEFRMRFR